MKQLYALISRDMRLMFARGADGFSAVFFFLLVCAMFPFALPADPALLQNAAPAVIWVCALLCGLLAQETIWQRDFEDGTFSYLLLSRVPAMAVVCAKTITHFLVAGALPAFAALVAAVMLQVPVAALGVLLLSLLMGGLHMSLLGGFGATLTLGARKPAMLTVLLVLPLYIPMLICGALALQAALLGESAQPYLLLQLAALLIALPVTLVASSMLLQAHVRT